MLDNIIFKVKNYINTDALDHPISLYLEQTFIQIFKFYKKWNHPSLHNTFLFFQQRYAIITKSLCFFIKVSFNFVFVLNVTNLQDQIITFLKPIKSQKTIIKIYLKRGTTLSILYIVNNNLFVQKDRREFTILLSISLLVFQLFL